MKRSIAQAAGSAFTWGLRHVAHRPAGNLPGKVALRIDPSLICELRTKIHKGSIMVVGTNGKTSVNNLLADVLEADGRSIVCNRTGANLATGIASTLLQTKGGDWGVFESDELWLARSLPQIQPDYVLLLNLFRDQLDRCGEIDRIQESIRGALQASPQTTLIYNADDPQCAIIALSVPNPKISFGVREDMGLSQNTVTDAQMCQQCEGMVKYRYRQYGQLGDYYCDHCDFKRPELDFAVDHIDFGGAGGRLTFEFRDLRASAPAPSSTSISAASASSATSSVFSAEVPHVSAVSAPSSVSSISVPAASVPPFAPALTISSPTSSPYLVYNLAAVATASRLLGCSDEALKKAIEAFDPKNGRLQTYELDGRSVLLNLAKNPTGFNQNLKIIERDRAPKAVGFFINDKVADGHDISWIWDIDFEELVSCPGTVVFAGGIRKNDVQVRLKYAGVHADLVDGVEDLLKKLPETSLPPDAGVYIIANYTALPAVHEALDALAARQERTPKAAKVPSASLLSTSPNAAVSPSTAPTGLAAESAATDDRDITADTHNATENEALTATNPAVEHAASADASPISVAERAAIVEPPLVIAHLFPDLLNLYGDGGNIRVLSKRLEWRGIPFEIRRVHYGESIDLHDVDLVFMGGGPDREQKLASGELMRMRDDLREFVENDGVLLAICGGYQILGRTWLLGDDEVEGLGIVGLETRRPGTSADRLIDNMVLSSPLATMPVVGYENHAGRTYLDTTPHVAGSSPQVTGRFDPAAQTTGRSAAQTTDQSGLSAQADGHLSPFTQATGHSDPAAHNDETPGDALVPFGKVISSVGHGNNDDDKADGIIYRKVIGSYSHGPLLSKNPEIADYLLKEALRHREKRTGFAAESLSPLDDSMECHANEYMLRRLGVL